MIPINVTIQYLRDGTKESRRVRLSLDDTIDAVIDKIATEFELGDTTDFQLLKLRTALDETCKLYEAGVQEGDILQLVAIDPNATVIGKIPSGSILNRLGGRASGERLTVSATLIASDGTRFLLRNTRAMIGRADANMGFPPETFDADLTALDPNRTVSRPHALIVYQNGEFSIRDLYSQLGVIHNGIRIPANTSQPLRNGDRLKFGNVELQFHREG
jgi:hypothetical protein